MAIFSASKQPRLRKTLGEALSDRNNILNLVRLFLASLVILGHAWPLTGSEISPNLEFLSGIAVEGFFVISGYLIAASRLNSGFLSFLWKRIVRIMPAFWVVLFLTAFVFAPFASLFESEDLNIGSSISYVMSNWFLGIQQWGIQGTLDSVPLPNAWNGSLWTLSYEFLAYLGLGVVLSFPLIRRNLFWALVAIFVGSVVVWALLRGPLDVSTNFYLNSAHLGSYFMAGAAYFGLRNVVPIRITWILVSAIVYVVLYKMDLNNFYGQAFLGYLLLTVGAINWNNPTTKNDISYGVYIYAFPVQQLLVLAGTTTFGLVANALLTFAITLIAAWLSWILVERPALGLKDVPEKLLSRLRRTPSI